MMIKEAAVTVKDEQRDMIVSVATEVFAKHGYKKATLELIGQSMGKVKSFVYYYFKNKEEIFEAVVDEEVARMKSEFDEILTSSSSASKKLEEYAKRRFTLIFQLANYFRMVSNGQLTDPKITEKLRKKYEEKELEHIQQILSQGIEEGEFAIGDVPLAALVLLTVLKGLEMPLFTSNLGRTSVEKRVDKLLAIVFNGIRLK
jgi:AcrR family transcriptional regulator